MQSTFRCFIHHHTLFQIAWNQKLSLYSINQKKWQKKNIDQRRSAISFLNLHGYLSMTAKLAEIRHSILVIWKNIPIQNLTQNETLSTVRFEYETLHTIGRMVINSFRCYLTPIAIKIEIWHSQWTTPNRQLDLIGFSYTRVIEFIHRLDLEPP